MGPGVSVNIDKKYSDVIDKHFRPGWHGGTNYTGKARSSTREAVSVREVDGKKLLFGSSIPSSMQTDLVYLNTVNPP